MRGEIDEERWDQVMKVGKQVEPRSESMKNDLDRADVNTIVGTMDFFDLHEDFIKQTIYDLTRPRFRVFDWLAMCLDGRCLDYGESEAQETKTTWLVKKLADIYIEQESIDGFINELRMRDLQIDFYEEVA